MTEHILNIAISLEDDKIISNIEKNAEKMITDDIKTEVLKRLFESRYYYLSNSVIKKDEYSKKIVVSKDAIFTDLANRIVERCLIDNKDAIIERASDKLCEAMKRTKKFKDAVDEVVS